jgi:hypothetical protein
MDTTLIGVTPTDIHYDGAMFIKCVIDKAVARTHTSIGVIVHRPDGHQKPHWED